MATLLDVSSQLPEYWLQPAFILFVIYSIYYRYRSIEPVLVRPPCIIDHLPQTTNHCTQNLNEWLSVCMDTDTDTDTEKYFVRNYQMSSCQTKCSILI